MASRMFMGTGGPAGDSGLLATHRSPLTDVAGVWSTRKADSESLKENHQADWTRFWRWYLNWARPMTDPADWWRSNVPDPLPFQVIETLVPKHVIGMWLSNEPFTVKGREKSDAEVAKKVQSLLMYMVDRMDLFPKLLECIKYTLIMGHSWGKVTWKTDVEERVREVGLPIITEDGGIDFRMQRMTEDVEVYNDPWFEWLMLDRVWADPSGRGRWFIEKIDTTLEELRETNETLGIYKNLGLIELAGQRPSSLEPFNESQDGHGLPESDTDISPSDGTKVELWQCWGWVPPGLRGADGNAWRLTVIANGMVEIRDEAVPTPDNRPPYFPIKAIPVPGRLYGESILRWIGPQADLKTKLSNMRMDEVTLGVWQQYIYDRDAITSNQMLFQPGGALPVDTQGGKVDDKVRVLERRPILGEVYVEDQARQAIIENVSAATPAQQGVADTSRQTATEISTLTSRGDQRFIMSIMWLDNTLKKQILERGFKFYQKQLPPGRMVRIIGTDYEDTVDISEIQDPVDIIVQSSMTSFNREARIQSVAELIQLTGSEAFAPWLKPRELIKQLAEDRGWTDVDKFVKQPEEFQQEQQAAIQQQVQMAQLQAALEAQTKIAIEQAKGQADAQGKQQELQLKAAEANLDMQMKQAEAQVKQIENRIKIEGKRAELLLQLEKARMELAVLREKAQIDITRTREVAAAQAEAARSKPDSKSGGKGR